MKTNITVIGDGGWGTALACILTRNGHNVTVWGPFEDNINAIRQSGTNEAFLPGVPLPPDLQWTTDPQQAASAGLIVLAIPTQYIHPVLTRFQGIIPPDAWIVSVTKGLDRDTHQTMTQIAQHTLNHPRIAALSGPSHAEEVARGIPTAVVVAAADTEKHEWLQNIFTCSTLRVYTSSDVTGVQIGGALKNVIAIAVGISDGLGFGDNTRAALITRGLAEISRLGEALDCQPATFAGLSGMGDLIVTCTSRHSRNRAVGERLGRGESLEAILQSMQQVAEGVWNCSNAYALAQEHHIEVPITHQVYRILHEGLPPMQAVQELMSRDTRPE